MVCRTIQLIADHFEEKERDYRIEEYPEDKRAVLITSFQVNNGPRCKVVFAAQNREGFHDCKVRVYELVSAVSPRRRGALLSLLNELNRKWPVRFYLRGEALDVADTMPMSLSDENVGVVAEEVLMKIGLVVNLEYSSIMKALFSREEEEKDHDKKKPATVHEVLQLIDKFNQCVSNTDRGEQEADGENVTEEKHPGGV